MRIARPFSSLALLAFSAFVSLSALISPNSCGQDHYWIQNNDGTWGSFNNWRTSVNNPATTVPGAGNLAIFDEILAGGPNPYKTAITVSIISPQSVGGILFDSSSTSYTIGAAGQSLVFTGSSASTNGNNPGLLDIYKTGDKNATIAANMNMQKNLSVGNTNASGGLSITNVVGNDLFQFNTANTHTGSLVVSGATDVIFNLSVGNNQLSNINSSTVNLSGGTNSVFSAVNSSINLSGGTNTLGSISGGSVNNTVDNVTIAGPVAFTNGSTHSVTGNNIGTMNIQGSLSYTNSVFSWQLNDDSSNTAQFDRVLGNNSGGLSGSGSTLSVNFGSNIDFNDVFWDSDQSWLIFSGFTFGASPFSNITLAGGTGPVPNTGQFSFSNGTLFFITAVPEPSSLVLVSLIGCCVIHRRRR